MTSHIGYSFECVCKNGFVGKYCEKGLYASLIYYDSIDIDNVFLFFSVFEFCNTISCFIQNKPSNVQRHCSWEGSTGAYDNPQSYRMIIYTTNATKLTSNINQMLVQEF